MKSQILLTRDDFREFVFRRDDHKCVICHEPAVDAHHILERRLFSDGGYYLDNGASLCAKHHILAEQTVLECEEIREAAGITEIVLPEHLYTDERYDKWGNLYMNNGTRSMGELFFDESVQKILGEGGVLGYFTNKIKYSRTFHLPWSPGMNRDDRMMKDVSIYEGQEIVAFEKLDGENTSQYTDYIHARSLDMSPHPSRTLAKEIWAQRAYNIPKDWRVCGENLFAKHALYYCNEPKTINVGTHLQPEYKSFPGGNALDDLFPVFSIWNERNRCLSWDETEEWIKLLDYSACPIYYKGIWSMDVIEKLNKFVEANSEKVEGYVIRLAREFHYSEFKMVTGKYVRKSHVQNNHGHWAQKAIIRNELKSNPNIKNTHNFRIE